MKLNEVLDSLDISFNADREAEQSIRCPFPDHDDRHASARLNLGKGLIYCHGCGQHADVIGLLSRVKGITIAAARELAGNPQVDISARKRRGGFKFKLKRSRSW